MTSGKGSFVQNLMNSQASQEQLSSQHGSGATSQPLTQNLSLSMTPASQPLSQELSQVTLVSLQYKESFIVVIVVVVILLHMV